jgi:hypothetical protein
LPLPSTRGAHTFNACRIRLPLASPRTRFAVPTEHTTEHPRHRSGPDIAQVEPARSQSYGEWDHEKADVSCKSDNEPSQRLTHTYPSLKELHAQACLRGSLYSLTRDSEDGQSIHSQPTRSEDGCRTDEKSK